MGVERRHQAEVVAAQTDSVEVIVSDSRVISRGSQFGHVAVQQTFRDSVGYVLRVSAEEKHKIETELKRRVAVTNREPANHGYSLLDDSCSSNVADVANLIGIVAYDPRWSAFGMISPEDIAVGLAHSKRIKEKRFYPKQRP